MDVNRGGGGRRRKVYQLVRGSDLFQDGLEDSVFEIGDVFEGWGGVSG
jgi:hypothetical protein